MTWRIVDLRRVTSPDGLAPLDLAQLRVAGRLFDGVDRAPELRFVELAPAPGDDEDLGCFLHTGALSVSKVHVDEQHRYDLWQIDPDTATLFLAGTTENVAGRCQSTWMTPDLMNDYEHAAALDRAMTEAGIW